MSEPSGVGWRPEPWSPLQGLDPTVPSGTVCTLHEPTYLLTWGRQSSCLREGWALDSSVGVGSEPGLGRAHQARGAGVLRTHHLQSGGDEAGR